jgi:hypothetical protein
MRVTYVHNVTKDIGWFDVVSESDLASTLAALEADDMHTLVDIEVDVDIDVDAAEGRAASQ